MGFTYYGDLLGISGYYQLGWDVAYSKLNFFYNETFSIFNKFADYDRESKISMFSDSLLITGCRKELKNILKNLQKLYINLLKKGMLLKGAVVKGKLEYDQRLTRDDFQKQLPNSDCLARAVWLGSRQKGARLLIENSLIDKLLKSIPEWKTIEGYNGNLYNEINKNDILRRICPTPDNNFYELLYAWVEIEPDTMEENSIIKILEHNSKMLDKKYAIHYKETINLIKRCNYRKNFTEQYFRSRNGINR
ncbi:MAG: hypothetical protein WHT07_10895 [Desulfobaccales bacterium]